VDWDNVKRKIECSNSQPAMTTLRSVVRMPAHRPPYTAESATAIVKNTIGALPPNMGRIANVSGIAKPTKRMDALVPSADTNR
jgi:hypothetical protein